MHIRKDSKGKKNDKKKNWTTFKDDDFKFRVSLVGLPNCGKSSLFNCLIGENVAVVDVEHGMTRDRK
jgi:tRNA U34 5-carboxymethylaminomethyl modifying GTPase MnmE/TrmE